MIKLGIESTSLCSPNPSGIANYTRNLIDSLYVNKQFTDEFDLKLFYKLSRFKKRKYRYVPATSSAVWHYKSVIPFERKLNLVHSPDNIYLNYKRSKKIVTIHDLAIFKKANELDGYTTQSFRDKVFYQLQQVAKSSDGIICVSENTKKDFLKLFNFKEENIVITHLGLRNRNKPFAFTDVLKKLNIIEKKYFLFVGMVSIRKNLINLIRAYNLSGLSENYPLVIAGEFSMGYEKIIREIEMLNLKSKVILCGFVGDNDLSVLYSKAKAFLFPTSYEGFGLPIIEAMSYGAPVLTSNTGAAPEVAGNNAILVNPFDVMSISNGINKVVHFTEFQIQSAKMHSQQFTWEKCAEKTMQFYKYIMEK